MSLTIAIKEIGLAVELLGVDEKLNADQGTVVRITATFHNFAGTRVDPAGISFCVEREADGVNVFYMYGTGEIVRDSVGVYHYDASTSAKSGVYHWRVTGTSPASGARQGSFYIEPSNP